MRRRAPALLPALASVLALSAAPAGAGVLRDRLYDAGDGVLVVAHRACHQPAPSHGFEQSVPENSLAALERCIALGVDLVEIDVRRTRDGVLVVMHDAKVDRTTEGKGRVSNLTLAEVQALRLKDAHGGTEAPPTLEAFLRAARGRILVNVDLKGPVAGEAAEIVRRTDAADWVLFKAKARLGAPPIADLPLYRDLAFMPMVASKAAKRAFGLAQITARQASGDRQIPAVEMVALKRQGFVAVRDAARAARIRVWTNTLATKGWRGVLDQSGDRKALRDPDRAWGRLIDQGVSIVQTDYPAALLDYLDHRGLRGHVPTSIAVADVGSPAPATLGASSRSR
ncbi:glycerophosphodiester phosphodiesterase family protein [Caulobacter segnis]|uniref:glycerophosphodiester phosphodiesterase family protein n=1 Tax=Caulobacter segnis TaxID=88688 RepID=UPI001CC0F496|nr:glycerophosphodiester phosphodiesterase family protein [Caulobacter segnis]UAL11410.1 glycerophosphodiester phosphodiesterase family protein [Caulobacter segnis]